MRIVIDEYNLQSYHSAFLVNDDRTFLEARKRLVNYKIYGKKGDLIVVSKYPYTAWFYDVENETDIIFEHILPSSKLKEKFKNSDIDNDLDEIDIVELDLINQTIEPTEISIINKFIGSFVFVGVDLMDQLYQITSFAANPSKKFLNSPYLYKKWSKYLDILPFKSDIEKSILPKIKECDVEFCKIANRLIYVSNSKYLLFEWLHDNKSYLESVLNRPISDFERYLSEYKYYAPFNEQYESQMEIFFKELYRQDKNLFFQEKSNYKASLKAYLVYAKNISQNEKEFISSNYKKILDFDLDEQIRALIKPELCPPPKVFDKPLSLQIEEWHKWAIEKFIPFKFYLDENQTEEEVNAVEEYANIYSDWLIENYESIVQNSLKNNYNITGDIDLYLNDYYVIWLIIDGFPCAYVETLKSILKENGINKIQDQYYFAAIPTITEIGIPTQLSGRFPQSDTFTTNREDSLKQAFGSKKTIFRSSIKTFQSALESDWNLCCLHWQEIDELMHKEDNAIENGRIEEIKRLLNVRIKQIANAIKSNYKGKIKLVISTDHGITKCLLKGQKIKNSSLLEACKDNPKERCIELKGPLSKVKIDETEVYYLSANRTMNLSDWVVAKGYRYFGRFDYGYRHGGLTPEETIVPFLTCEIAQNELLPLRIILSGLTDLPIGFTESFKFQISNDNEALVEICKISILEDKNFKIEKLDKIPARSSKTFEGRIKLPKALAIKDGTVAIKIFINYIIFGELLEQELLIKLPVRHTGNEGLDELIK